MRFIDWFSDSLASIDVVDGCITELKDINLTDEEQTETAFFDAMAEEIISTKTMTGQWANEFIDDKSTKGGCSLMGAYYRRLDLWLCCFSTVA